MTESRNSEQHTKGYREKTDLGVTSTSARGGAERVAAGRTAYREEFQRDYGPDLDEPLDRAEAGREF